MTLKIVSVQLPNSTDLAANLARIWSALERAAAVSADLVLFPECTISGFSAKMGRYTLDDLAPHLRRIEAWAAAHKLCVVLPSGVMLDDARYNVAFVLRDGPRLSIFKRGLTPSELGFFSAPATSDRSFLCRGYRCAVLICAEAEQPAWSHLDQNVDLVLWPGYWGWSLDEPWAELREGGSPCPLFANQRQWARPMIQSNFSGNALGDGRQGGPSGLSVFIRRDGAVAGRGAHAQEGAWLLTLTEDALGLEIRDITEI